MQLRRLSFFFGIIAVLGLWLGNSQGRATTANQGNTGAPEDNGQGIICASCHNGGNFGTALDIAVFDELGNAVVEYTPETTYTVRVTVNADNNPVGYGFQLTALRAPLDATGPDVPTFANPTPNAQIATATSSTNPDDPTRQYVEHNGISAANVFEVQWTAPAAASGPVSFYSCGNAVNGNGGSNGDAGDCASFELAETITSTENAATALAGIDWLTNPVTDGRVRLGVRSAVPTPATLRLVDGNGRVLVEQQLQLTEALPHEFALPTGTAAGHYVVQLLVGERVHSRSLVVR